VTKRVQDCFWAKGKGGKKKEIARGSQQAQRTEKKNGSSHKEEGEEHFSFGYREKR